MNFYCIKQIDYIDYKMITHFTTLLHHLKIHFCIRFPSGTLKFFRVKIYLDDLSLTNVNNHTCEIIYFSSDGNITDYFPLNGNGVVDLSIYFLFPFPFFIFILVGAEGRGHAPNTIMKAAESLAKEYIYYYYNDISIVLCVQGCQNLKLFTKYMIELNVHLLVADGIERLFVGAYYRSVRLPRVVSQLRTCRARFCLPKF